MAKRKRKTGMEEAAEVVLGFANLVDVLFLKYTGKTVQTLLKEPQVHPRELPSGQETVSYEPGMPLAGAYAILGLKPDASLEE